MGYNLDEFADDHEEQHALGTGFGVGVLLAAGLQFALGPALAGLVLVFVVRIVRQKRPAAADTQDLLNDIRREPHYFATALGAGLLAALAVI